ncbi:MAG: hypothetical protein AAF063_26115, partial [Cyanobacteria bacterium J06643_5]
MKIEKNSVPFNSLKPFCLLQDSLLPTHTNNYGFATLREQKPKRIPISLSKINLILNAHPKIKNPFNNQLSKTNDNKHHFHLPNLRH